MFQVAYNYQKPWRENQLLHVEGQFACDVAISPTVARRKANGFLASQVTMMVSAGEPLLLLGDKPVWQTPAVLRLPQHGEVGTVGTIEVDAQTGEVITPSHEQIQHMQELANALAAHFTLPPATTS
jgi:hypothetical protein